MSNHEKLPKAFKDAGIDTGTYGGRRILDAANKIIAETLHARIREGADLVIERERNNAWRSLRELTPSLDGDTEEYIEYGISYADEPPRTHTFTPYYDVAMSDLANRLTMHGDSMGTIRIRQRRNVLKSSQWMDAVRPAWNDQIDATASL